MKNSRRDQDQVYAQWISRTEDAQEASQAEAFADELWDTGLRLSREPHTHYQLVMGVIRGAIQHTNKKTAI